MNDEQCHVSPSWQCSEATRKKTCPKPSRHRWPNAALAAARIYRPVRQGAFSGSRSPVSEVLPRTKGMRMWPRSAFGVGAAAMVMALIAAGPYHAAAAGLTAAGHRRIGQGWTVSAAAAPLTAPFHMTHPMTHPMTHRSVPAPHRRHALSLSFLSLSLSLSLRPRPPSFR